MFRKTNRFLGYLLILFYGFSLHSMESQTVANQILASSDFPFGSALTLEPSHQSSFHQIKSIPHSFNLYNFLNTPDGQKWADAISCEKLKKTVASLKKGAETLSVPFENLNIGCSKKSSAYHALLSCYWILKAIFSQNSQASNKNLKNLYDFNNIAELFWDNDLNKKLRDADVVGKWRKLVIKARKEKEALVFGDPRKGLDLSIEELQSIIKSEFDIFSHDFKPTDITFLDEQKLSDAEHNVLEEINSLFSEFSKNKNKVHAFIIKDINGFWYTLIANKIEHIYQFIVADSSGEIAFLRLVMGEILHGLNQDALVSKLNPNINIKPSKMKSEDTCNSARYQNTNNSADEIDDPVPAKTLTMAEFIGDIPVEVKAAINTLNNPKLKDGDQDNALLLYGPPGTGKTHLAKVIAGETKRTLFEFNGSGFVNKFQGSGPKSVKKIFDFAKRFGSPCIIFIDEIDGLGFKRSAEKTDEREAGLRILLTMLNNFANDDLIFIIAATNTKNSLDDAILRRFPRKVMVDLPNEETRMKLLEFFCSKIKIYEKKISGEYIYLHIRNWRIPVLKINNPEELWKLVSGKITNKFNISDLKHIFILSVTYAQAENRNFIDINDIQRAFKSILDEMKDRHKEKAWSEYFDLQNSATVLNMITNLVVIGSKVLFNLKQNS